MTKLDYDVRNNKTMFIQNSEFVFSQLGQMSQSTETFFSVPFNLIISNWLGFSKLQFQKKIRQISRRVHPNPAMMSSDDGIVKFTTVQPVADSAILNQNIFFT
jgi:hypothetical protein